MAIIKTTDKTAYDFIVDRDNEILRRIKEQTDKGKSTCSLEGQLFELRFLAVRLHGITLGC